MKLRLKGERSIRRWSSGRGAWAMLCAAAFSLAIPARARAQANPPGKKKAAPAPLGIPWISRQKLLEGMVQIPDGPFQRGDTPGGAAVQAPRKILLPSFYVDRLEVSRAAYHGCVAAGVCGPARTYPGPEGDDLPVTGVTWYQARDYCLWAGKRLPTEAEWEKAARGDTGWAYPWGDALDLAKSNAGAFRPAAGGADPAPPVVPGLAPAESYPEGASPFGVLNLVGNAAEWVLDWYDPDYFKRAPVRTPRGPAKGTLKVVRGGSYLDDPAEAASALSATARRAAGSFTARLDIGFRCAWVPEEDLTQVGDPP